VLCLVWLTLLTCYLESSIQSALCRRVEDTSGLCVVVDPLLSDVSESGHLSGLPLVKLFISGSILCCPVTVHFSLFCVFWLVLLAQFHHSVTTWTILTVLSVLRSHFHHFVSTWTGHSGFPLSFLLKASPFSAVFTVSGNLFQHSTDLTANECFLVSILAYWTARPCPPAACLVLAPCCTLNIACPAGLGWVTNLCTRAMSWSCLLFFRVSRPSSEVSGPLEAGHHLHGLLLHLLQCVLVPLEPW
jgi:hypothetical protein